MLFLIFLSLERFVSLDGVDWTDPGKREKVHIGQAVTDFVRMRGESVLEPTSKEKIARVPGSMALKLADHNYIMLAQSLASMGAPVVINNACSSWHRLAQTFTFGGARAYIGTLFDVLDPEAHGVMNRVFGKYLGRPLPLALWRAQNDVAGNGIRRPYVMVGCHFQRLRPQAGDNRRYLLERLKLAVAAWNRHLTETAGESQRAVISRKIEFLEQQIAAIVEHSRAKKSRSALA